MGWSGPTKADEDDEDEGEVVAVRGRSTAALFVVLLVGVGGLALAVDDAGARLGSASAELAGTTTQPADVAVGQDADRDTGRSVAPAPRSRPSVAASTRSGPRWPRWAAG